MTDHLSPALKQIDDALDTAGDRVNDVADVLRKLERTEFVSTSSAWMHTMRAVLIEAVQLGLMLEGLRRQLEVDVPADPETLGTYVCQNCANAKHLACNNAGCKCICTVKEIRIPAGTKIDLGELHPVGSKPCCATPGALGKSVEKP